MKDKLSAFWSGFKDKWSSLAKNLRIFIITAVSVVIVAAIVLAIVLNQKGYTAIYTGLDSEESSQVVSAINELGITDVKMGTDGSIVKSNMVYTLCKHMVYMLSITNEHKNELEMRAKPEWKVHFLCFASAKRGSFSIR